MLHFGEEGLVGLHVEFLEVEGVELLELREELLVLQLELEEQVDDCDALVDARHAAGQAHGHFVWRNGVDVELEAFRVVFVGPGQLLEAEHARLVLLDLEHEFFVVAAELQVVFGESGVLVLLEALVEAGDHHGECFALLVVELVFVDGADAALDLGEHGGDFEHLVFLVGEAVRAHDVGEVLHLDDGGVDDVELLLGHLDVVDEFEVVLDGVVGLQQFVVAALDEVHVLGVEVVVGDGHQRECARDALLDLVLEARVQPREVDLQDADLELVAEFVLEGLAHGLLLADGEAEGLRLVLGLARERRVDHPQVVAALVEPVEVDVVALPDLLEDGVVGGEERVDAALRALDGVVAHDHRRGVDEALVHRQAADGLWPAVAQREEELADVAGVGERLEDKDGLEAVDEGVLEELLDVVEVGLDADCLAAEPALVGVLRLRDFLSLHGGDDHFGEEDLEGGVEAEVFALEVRVHDVVEVPVEDVVVVGVPVDDLLGLVAVLLLDSLVGSARRDLEDLGQVVVLRVGQFLEVGQPQPPVRLRVVDQGLELLLHALNAVDLDSDQRVRDHFVEHDR